MIKINKKKINRLSTTTCVFCHSANKSIDHLFIHHPFVERIWNHLCQIFRAVNKENVEHWNLNSILRLGTPDLIVRDLIWNIWLERNTYIFRDKFTLCLLVIIKIIYMFLSWITVALEIKNARMKDLATTVKHSLEFLNRSSFAGNIGDMIAN